MRKLAHAVGVPAHRRLPGMCLIESLFEHSNSA